MNFLDKYFFGHLPNTAKIIIRIILSLFMIFCFLGWILLALKGNPQNGVLFISLILCVFSSAIISYLWLKIRSQGSPDYKPILAPNFRLYLLDINYILRYSNTILKLQNSVNYNKIWGKISVSGWQDSNLRPPAPKAGAITGLRYTPKMCKFKNLHKKRRDRDSNPGYPFQGTTIQQTVPFGHSGTSPLVQVAKFILIVYF